MKETRGRLSSLDLIPDEGQDDVRWALDQLNERKRTQADILFELNDRLAAKGIDGVSKSAFNRKAVRIAMTNARKSEAAAIYAAVGKDLTAEKIDDASIAIGEMIKTLLIELLDENARTITPTGAMEIAQAYAKTITGQKMSGEIRTIRQKEFEAKASAAIEKVGKARGLSSATVDEIKAQILGLRREPAQEQQPQEQQPQEQQG